MTSASYQLWLASLSAVPFKEASKVHLAPSLLVGDHLGGIVFVVKA